MLRRRCNLKLVELARAAGTEAQFRERRVTRPLNTRKAEARWNLDEGGETTSSVTRGVRDQFQRSTVHPTASSK